MLSSARDRTIPIGDVPPLSVELVDAAGTSQHELRSERPLTVVGRSPNCDIRLQDVEVSRCHALLVRWEQAVFCIDLGSRAGTRFEPEGSVFSWLTATVTAAIGPYRLKAGPGVLSEPGNLELHRDLLWFDRTHDWQLQFLTGDVQPGSYTLRRPLTLIGRNESCKIQLKLRGIKSVHAALLVTPDGLYLRDLSGLSDLRVDNESWRDGWLNDGQVVELGPVKFRIAKVEPTFTARMPEAETDDPTGGATLEAIDPRFESISHLGQPCTAPPRPLTQPILSGRYQIVKRIARGGMGVVYEGLDVRLHRVVAIKVVRGKGDATRLGRQRLLREAMVSARVEHPNIVRVLDADREGRYAVFEYVSGETLGDTLRRCGAFKPVQAASWMAQVADAIEHLGQHGIVHRDIKPANVLVANSGIAKLVDFGLASIADVSSSKLLATLTEETERPRKGIAIGTAPFASPEQFANAQATDTRSDIYSAGCTLYALLAARPPYFGTATETYRLHLEGSPPPIEGVPAPLFAIIEKCLAKAPADRYQTGAEFATDLRSFAARS